MFNKESNNILYLNQIGTIIQSTKILAKQYRKQTGRPLGITGEVAEYEAARLLNLEIAAVRQPGYDAIRRSKDKRECLKIKDRCVLNSKPSR